MSRNLSLNASMQGRRWVIQEQDAEGRWTDRVVLTPRQVELAYAAAAGDGHVIALASGRLAARFTPAEWEFLRQHYFRLLERGVTGCSLYFDDEDAAQFREAFDQAPVHLLEMAVQIYSPAPPWPWEQVRFGWEEVFKEPAPNLGHLVQIARSLAQAGGCFLSVDLQGAPHKYYARRPAEAEVAAEADKGRRIIWWSAAP